MNNELESLDSFSDDYPKLTCDLTKEFQLLFDGITDQVLKKGQLTINKHIFCHCQDCTSVWYILFKDREV